MSIQLPTINIAHKFLTRKADTEIRIRLEINHLLTQGYGQTELYQITINTPILQPYALNNRTEI